MAGMASAAAVRSRGASLPTTPDVVVIGAGSAGIGAARRLMSEGRSVLVVEAANRIGGRAYTETRTFGVPYDHGCAWLQGPRSLPHLEIIEREGFHTVNHQSAGENFRVDGEPASKSQNRAYGRAFDAMWEAAYSAGDVSLASVMPEVPYRAEALAWTAMGYGADARAISTADMNAYVDYEVDLLIREGLGTVVSRLGQGIPVKLNCAATAVDWRGEGVVVQTTEGSIKARACIVTVSTGVLASGALRFTPDLPQEKYAAIDDLPMGLLTKVALQFNGERFGLSANDWLSYALDQLVPAKACYFVTFPTDLELAVGFLGGSLAWDIAREGEAAAIDFATEAFSKAVGNDARKHFVKGHMSDWHANPLVKGAYAAARPGRHMARAQLKAPLGRQVFFAGEAVGVPLAALCSGAHLSGDSTALLVHAVLSQRASGCSSCDARGRAKTALRGKTG